LTFDDEELLAYRVDNTRTVHESLNLIAYSQVDFIQDYQASESKDYKKYEGKLDQTPTESDRKTFDSDTLRCIMVEHKTYKSTPNEQQVPLNDSDDEDQFIYDDEDGYDLTQLTHRISVADYENETARSTDESENPLEAGQLFTILCRKFNKLLSNSKTENVYLTSIFAKLASIPLSDENPATYYLHAFIYCELKKK
jgi:hypothetical protein